MIYPHPKQGSCPCCGEEVKYQDNACVCVFNDDEICISHEENEEEK